MIFFIPERHDISGRNNYRLTSFISALPDVLKTVFSHRLLCFSERKALLSDRPMNSDLVIQPMIYRPSSQAPGRLSQITTEELTWPRRISLRLSTEFVTKVIWQMSASSDFPWASTSINYCQPRWWRSCPGLFAVDVGVPLRFGTSVHPLSFIR